MGKWKIANILEMASRRKRSEIWVSVIVWGAYLQWPSSCSNVAPYLGNGCP